MKKEPREPLARNEPLRKKKPAVPAPAPAVAPVKTTRPLLLRTTEDHVRVFRPSTPVPAPLPSEFEGVAPRKLIRTTLEEVRRRQAEGKIKINEKAMTGTLHGPHVGDQTNAEHQYLSDLIEGKVQVVVKLVNGDTVQGWIEYIDRNFIRLTRDGRSNLFIYKHEIRYLEEVKKAEAVEATVGEPE